MKKLPVLLAATTLATSISVFAHPISNDASPFSVSVPHIKSGFQFDVEGMLLKPTNSDLDFGLVSVSNIGSSQGKLLSVKPDTESAWRVGVGYVFPDSGNDVQLHWGGFDHAYTDARTFTPAQYNQALYTPTGSLLIVTDVSQGNGEVLQADSRAQFKLSEVDLDAGQYVNIGSRLQLRPFAGLRFASLESNVKNHYTEVGDAIDGSIREENYFHSKFNGLGPRLGADADYQLGGGFGAVGHLATSLLFGKVATDSSFMYEDASSKSPGVASSSFQSDKVNRVVPVVEAKLGLNYRYTFDCDSVLTVEGGYTSTQYIDAVDRLSHSNGQYGESISRATSSVGFSGPYVKLAVKL